MSESEHDSREEMPHDESERAETEDEAEVDTSHLDGLEDGCGCAEVMEHLSEQREQ